MFDQMVSAYDDLELDGVWLDMNEATNFCDGYCIEEERPKNSLRNKPYYVPGERDLRQGLARHLGGTSTGGGSRIEWAQS